MSSDENDGESLSSAEPEPDDLPPEEEDVESDDWGGGLNVSDSEASAEVESEPSLDAEPSEGEGVDEVEAADDEWT